MDRRTEIITGVASYVKSHYDGDYQKAFDTYAGIERTLSPDDVERILKDSHVGGFFRDLYVNGIFKELDTNRDRVISWEEFSKAFNGD